MYQNEEDDRARVLIFNLTQGGIFTLDFKIECGDNYTCEIGERDKPLFGANSASIIYSAYIYSQKTN